MISKLTPGINSLLRGRFIVLSAILAACIILTMGLDFLEARFHHSSFYFSESFLFSSFWWLFVPLLYGQFFIVKIQQTKISILVRIVVPVAIHLFTYPALVWLISGLFYYHTFAYLQTLNYGLTQYFFIVWLVYSVPFLFYRSFKNSRSARIDSPKPTFLTNLLVLDGNRRTNIFTKDILYIAANPPYINIHHPTRRYLHKQTLKSISEKLDNEIFVRIHKSTIVNIAKVHSYRSRLNGDYDLLLNDGSEIRLSRNYVSNFKVKFAKTHQDTL